MKTFEESSSFYTQAINLIDLKDLDAAIKFVRKKIENLKKPDDIALAYLICGFLNDKLGDNISAIKDFSKTIAFESELETINERSKDVAFCGRSNSRYKNQDFQGAIEDKIKAKQIRSSEIDRPSELKIDYKNILLGTFLEIDLEPKYSTLIKASKITKSRYDLIADYKKVITKKRKKEIIEKLEFLSKSKYNAGDYKGSIKAIRRAEKYI